MASAGVSAKTAGQKSAQNGPSATAKKDETSKEMGLRELEEMERKLQGDLIRVENEIYLTETKYLKLTSQSGGNVFKGWEGQGPNTKTAASIAAVTGSHRRQNRINN